MSAAPITTEIANFISRRRSASVPADVPADVIDYTRLLTFDAIGTLAAATHPMVTSSAGIGAFAVTHGGAGTATLIGQATKVDVANAALANGTCGYAIDMEPHHPEAILHPMAVLVPTAL
ncbi:MAG: MmgE/PrpD family protein, partial [Gammaproteobacteria bacterium]